jgi:AraC-like DNA-binding protein
MNNGIPSYDISRGDELSLPFKYLVLEQSDGGYDPSLPHRHNYFEIFYFVVGGGEHDIDFRTHEIRDGSIHFVTPGQVHQVRRSAGSHGFIILFTREFNTLGPRTREIPLLVSGASNQVLQPDEEERTPLLDALRMIAEESERQGRFSDELLRSYLNIFLLHSHRLFEKYNPVADATDISHELVRRLQEQIEENFMAMHAPADYAELLNVSANHLNTTVRRMLGKTISDMIHERIILEAKRLLFHTQASIKEIAHQLNYDDPSYFTRFFRSQTGVSPVEFRENIINN